MAKNLDEFGTLAGVLSTDYLPVARDAENAGKATVAAVVRASGVARYLLAYDGTVRAGSGSVPTSLTTVSIPANTLSRNGASLIVQGLIESEDGYDTEHWAIYLNGQKVAFYNPVGGGQNVAWGDGFWFEVVRASETSAYVMAVHDNRIVVYGSGYLLSGLDWGAAQVLDFRAVVDRSLKFYRLAVEP